MGFLFLNYDVEVDLYVFLISFSFYYVLLFFNFKVFVNGSSKIKILC